VPWWGCLTIAVVALGIGGWGGYLLAVSRTPHLVARMTDLERTSFVALVAALRQRPR
jgi:hypothetical protein